MDPKKPTFIDGTLTSDIETLTSDIETLTSDIEQQLKELITEHKSRERMSESKQMTIPLIDIDSPIHNKETSELADSDNWKELLKTNHGKKNLLESLKNLDTISNEDMKHFFGNKQNAKKVAKTVIPQLEEQDLENTNDVLNSATFLEWRSRNRFEKYNDNYWFSVHNLIMSNEDMIRDFEKGLEYEKTSTTRNIKIRRQK